MSLIYGNQRLWRVEEYMEEYRSRRWHLYVIRARQSGHVKIGISRNLPLRVSMLGASTWEELELVHACPGSTKLERRLHRQFADERMHHEWFRGHGIIARWIEAGCPIDSRSLYALRKHEKCSAIPPDMCFSGEALGLCGVR